MNNNNIKLSVICVINIIFVIFWMLSIFYFSSQTGEISDVTSSSTLRKIIKIFNTSIDNNNLDILVCKYNLFLRKFTHFSIYCVGGILVCLMYSNLNKLFYSKVKYVKLYSSITGIVYATSDEIHQYFVPNRSCELRDIFIDSLGFLTGVIVLSLIICILRKIKKK